MQFKVPQNIDKEDQIVGPLTITQFSYVAIAGALDVLINQSVAGPVKYLLIGIISLIGLAFAFFKIQDRPLLYFVAAAISFAMQPKTRVWHKMNDRPVLQIQKNAAKAVSSIAPKKAYDPKRIAELTKVVDREANAPAKTPTVFDNVDSSSLTQK